MSRSFNSVDKSKPKIKYGKVPTLHVVDASNWMYRAYFATLQNGMTAPDGTPTGGIKQFLTMIEDLLRQIEKDPNGAYIAVCFDPSSKSTWRYKAMTQWQSEQKKKYVKQVFPKSADYKGNRDKTKQSNLPQQMQFAIEILRHAGIWVGLKAPYEADDVVGTLSHRFCRRFKVKLYSRDKDYVQLVDHPNVELIMQKQANSEERRFDLTNVGQFMGVPVERIVDFLALAGDSADNVPGVPGISDGLAAKFINEYGSAKKFQRAAQSHKSNAKWRRALCGEIPMMDLDMQIELVTIDRNVPTLPRNIEAFGIKTANKKALTKIKKRLGFRSLIGL